MEKVEQKNTFRGFVVPILFSLLALAFWFTFREESSWWWLVVIAIFFVFNYGMAKVRNNKTIKQ